MALRMKYDLYDFDGTIYDGDSGVDLVLFAIKKKPYLSFKIFKSSYFIFVKVNK